MNGQPENNPPGEGHLEPSGGEYRPEIRRFDAFALAREHGEQHGTVLAPNLARLAERLVGDAGPLAWRIEGGSDTAGRPALTVALDGAVMLECQRCLGPVRHPIAQRTMTVLARNEAEADSLDLASDLEVLVVDGKLDPASVVEDELLLALPFAPMHPPGECESLPVGQ